jgi:hypothetical protein
MINTPDLPTAPMTRWVMYLSLFDFNVNHVPAEKHLSPDGLSQRKKSPLDSDDKDVEEYLDNFIGSVACVYAPSPSVLSSSIILAVMLTETNGGSFFALWFLQIVYTSRRSGIF